MTVDKTIFSAFLLTREFTIRRKLLVRKPFVSLDDVMM